MKILIVDDDRVLADIVSYTFRREGFEVILGFDGLSAMDLWAIHQPDLIILDINLPELDGFAVCRQIRSQSSTPILMLTVRGEDDDVVHGLEIGADDYVSKPFSPRRLVARAHAVLRRTGKHGAVQGQPPLAPRKVGGLHLEANDRELRIDGGEIIQLSEQEGRLLEFLMINAGQFMPGERIFDQVWGTKGGDPDDLRQLVRRLRNKIEPNPAKPVFIKNIPGYGYGLMIPEERFGVT